jgi:hypothetical protein
MRYLCLELLFHTKSKRKHKTNKSKPKINSQGAEFILSSQLQHGGLGALWQNSSFSNHFLDLSDAILQVQVPNDLFLRELIAADSHAQKQ